MLRCDLHSVSLKLMMVYAMAELVAIIQLFFENALNVNITLLIKHVN